MQATIDGVRWRLRFQHQGNRVPKFADQAELQAWVRRQRKSRRNGSTFCFIEIYEDLVEVHGWRPVFSDFTFCGRGDAFQKEQGRQFSLIRVLRSWATFSLEGLDPLSDDYKAKLKATRRVQSALIAAYVESGNRKLCRDIHMKGFVNIYDAVFDPDGLWAEEAVMKAADEADRLERDKKSKVA